MEIQDPHGSHYCQYKKVLVWINNLSGTAYISDLICKYREYQRFVYVERYLTSEKWFYQQRS